MWLKKLTSFALSLFLILLPWQGAMSAFLPKIFHFWKEYLLLFTILLLVSEIFFSPKKGKKKIKKFLKKPLFLTAFLFLCWGFFLIVFAPDQKSALIAFRYIGFGFLVFLMFSFLFESDKKFFTKNFFPSKNRISISEFFIFSNVGSVLFGIYMKFFGGITLLKSFYSPTISSWVPGQKTPIYHMTSDFIRLQGGASGPIEFSHLCFIALFLLLLKNQQKNKKKNTGFPKHPSEIFSFLILSFGILQSGSRAAILVTSILVSYFMFKPVFSSEKEKTDSTSSFLRQKICFLKNHFFKPEKIVQKAKILLILICLIAGLKFLINTPPIVSFIENNTNFPQNNPVPPLTDSKTKARKNLEKSPLISFFFRLGDSDHFSRPIQGLKIWTKKPITGALGSVGPAARIKNLAEKNSDKAFIAENVWIDVLVQTGIIGLFLFTNFFVFLASNLIAKKPKNYFLLTFLGLFVLLMNFATLFDMTPISISFFLVMSLLIIQEPETT